MKTAIYFTLGCSCIAIALITRVDWVAFPAVLFAVVGYVSWLAERANPAEQFLEQHRHVRIVSVPYDWAEEDSA